MENIPHDSHKSCLSSSGISHQSKTSTVTLYEIDNLFHSSNLFIIEIEVNLYFSSSKFILHCSSFFSSSSSHSDVVRIHIDFYLIFFVDYYPSIDYNSFTILVIKINLILIRVFSNIEFTSPRLNQLSIIIINGYCSI